MAWFTLVGHIAGNKSGVGARGYHVFRRGTAVVCRFGKIEVTGGGASRFKWAHHVSERVYRCRTVKKALEHKKLLEQGLMTPFATRDAYRRLPRGVRLT